jgi:hypothetical protein
VVGATIGNGYTTARGGSNVASANGNKADAIAVDKYNLAFAQGNTRA